MQSTGRELYAVFYHNSASSFSDLRGPVISNVTRDLLTMTSRGNSKRTNRFVLRQFFNFFFSLAFGTSAFEQSPAKIQFSAPKLSFPKIVSTFLWNCDSNKVIHSLYDVGMLKNILFWRPFLKLQVKKHIIYPQVSRKEEPKKSIISIMSM